MVGYFLTSMLVLQVGLGYSPIKAALTAIPTAVGMTIGFAVLGQKLIAKMGRSVISLGATIFAAGLVYTTWIFSHYLLQAHPWQFIPGLLVTGIGLSLIMIPIFSAALQDVDVNHAGSASGVLNAVQQVGAAIGIAVIGVIFFGHLSNGAYKSFDQSSAVLRQEIASTGLHKDAQDAIIGQVRTCFHDRSTQKDSASIPESCKTLESGQSSAKSDNPIVTSMQHTALEANARNFASAFRSAVIYVILLLVVVCALSLTLPRKFKMIEETV
jgi:hypothetical protein